MESVQQRTSTPSAVGGMAAFPLRGQTPWHTGGDTVHIVPAAGAEKR